MIVQWCLKGLNLPDDAAAIDIIDGKSGIQCRWWRDVQRISSQAIREKLTADNLDMHVNQFESRVPGTNKRFEDVTPFISLTAGTVERDTTMATNVAHGARRIALHFGSQFGQLPVANIFECWVILAPRRCVEVESVAEEVRDLNVYRSYSDFQTEGEVTAKIAVPANQIRRWERWETDSRGIFCLSKTYENSEFTPPEALSNIRELIQ